MPKKIRDLRSDLRRAGWTLVKGGGKGSHTKYKHPNVPRKVTLAGADGSDAKPYQEVDVANAVREAEES